MNAKKSTDKRGWRVAAGARVAAPGRMLLLEFLAASGRPVTADDISARFGLTPAAAAAVVGRLGRMRAAGLVLLDRKGRYALPREMDLIAGRVVGHANGYGFVIPDDGGGDLFLHHRQMRKVLHGDRVLARLKRIDHRGRKEGVVVEALIDPQREIVGRFHLEGGIGFVEPDDARFARDITLPAGGQGAATDGDIVAARIIRHPAAHQHAVGEVVEVLGRHAQPGMETDIAIRKHAIPTKWRREVRAELAGMKDALAGVKPSRADKRVDLRALPLVTIDGEDARDFDDAVFGAPVDGDGDGKADGAGDGKHRGAGKRGRGDKTAGKTRDRWRLIVAIADVSHYVVPGGALDAEALQRGNSVYFPNRVVPMLPTELSNGICSLNPGADRHCMACDMRIDARGAVTAFEFYPALMHSNARLTYTEVDAIVGKRDAKARRKRKALAPHLDHLRAIAGALGRRRKRRGSIDFDFPEPFIEFDAQQKIRRITQRARNTAHRLIEECMLAANCCAAEFLRAGFGAGAGGRGGAGGRAGAGGSGDGDRGGAGGRAGAGESAGAIFRNHYGPEADSLADLRRALDGLGLKLGGGEAPVAGDYAKLVDAVAGAALAPVVQLLLLRSLSQAEYSTAPAGHFALAFPLYTHFTSPIRRYSDLVVHRQIRALLAGKVGRKPGRKTGKKRARAAAPKFAPEGVSLERVAEQCSITERRAEDASRDVLAYLKAEFMQDKVGEEFAGAVSGVTAFGVFVQLRELFVDGLVHVTGLGDDYFHFDPLRLRLTGQRSGRQFQLGDELRVRVAAVSLESAKIDFELCGDAVDAPVKRRKKRGKRR